MSTTHPSSAQNVARDTTDLYDILILRSPTRCATCHQRIRDKTELDADESHDGVGTGNRPDAVFERVGTGTIGHDIEAKDDYGAQCKFYTRTYCADCGRPSSRTTDATPDIRTMLARISPLLKTLDRNDVPYCEDTMRQVIHHLKSNDDTADRVTDIWRTATALAVEHA